MSFSLFGQTFQNGFNFYLPPYDTTTQAFLPDFSVEPIGTNDFVAVNAEGNFEVNGKQLRIYAANIFCDPGLYPDKNKAPFLAARLRKFGFNAVRFHTVLNAGWGLKLLGGPDKFNEDRLDKFFFFVNELKKQGIRLVLSWNYEIAHTKAEGIQVPDSVPAAHAICDYYDRKLIEVRKNYFNYFVSRVNPYTGLALKNDPVFSLVEVVNENWLFQYFAGNALKPISEGGILASYYSMELDSLWNQYLFDKYKTEEGLQKAWQVGSISSTNILQDKSFENSSPGQYWKLMALNGANAALQFMNGDGVDGNICGKVTITNSTGTDWHVQFYQDGFTVEKDTAYQIKFWAKADKNISITSSLAKLGAPYTVYGNKQFNLSTSWQEYSFTASPNETNANDAYLSFSLGSNAGSIYFDNVTLSKYSGVELLKGETLALKNIKRFQKSELMQFGGRRKLDVVAFYIDLQEKYFDEFYSFMKNECGIRIPISGQNFLIGAPDNKIQSRLDYIDKHGYWNLPLPDASGSDVYINKSMTQDPEGSIIVELFRGVGYKNKPLTFSEYNHAYFTDYYVESQFLLTAYSSLHDADGMMYFCFASGTASIEEDIVTNCLDFSRNNVQMSFAPTFAKAFRDKLISVSTQPVELKMTNDDLTSSPFPNSEWTPYPLGFPKLQALNHKIVVSDYNSSIPFSENVIPAEPTNPYISDTHELAWDKNGLFTITTPKFIAAVGFLQNYPNKEIGNLKMVNGNVFGGFSWISLTNDSLYSATKSLLTIGTKQENTNTVWNSTKTKIINLGTAPTIIQPALVTFELKLKADSVRIHELGTMGERTGRFNIYYPVTANTFRITFDQTVTKTLWFGVETAWSTDIHTLRLMTVPDSGFPIYGNDIFRIEWQGEFVSSVKLELSINNGRTWSPIADSIDNSIGHYDWTVPDVKADSCLIRITDDDASVVSDVSNIPFQIEKQIRKNMLDNGDFANGLSNWMTNVNSSASASFAVLNGGLSVAIQNGGTAGWHIQLFQFGKKIEKGKTYDISIDASASATRSLDAGVSQNGGSYTQYGSHIFNITPTMQTYSFSFTMNNTTDAQSQFVVGVGNSTVGVKLDNITLREHSIEKSLAITSPKSSDVWKVNKSYDINWTSNDINKINIFYKLASQSSWTAIASNLSAGIGKFTWTVPLLSLDSCQVKIEDAEDNSVNSVSSKFYIVVPTVEIRSPKEDERLLPGGNYQIEWTSQFIDTLTIFYKFWSAASWTKFGDKISASALKYSWTIPNVANDSCQIKIEDYKDASINNISPKFYIKSLSSINENIIPSEYSLSQNFPNPFNPVTRIRYQIPTQTFVRILLYDVLGNEVQKLVCENQEAGYYDVELDGSDLTTGIYLLKLHAGSFTSTKKIVLVK